MTFNNIPKNLVDELCACYDRIELAIRADERSQLLAKFRKGFPTEPVAKPAPVTGLHGEELFPQRESDPQPNDLTATHAALVSWLSQGTFLAVPTLAGHLGIKKQSVYHYLSGLKKAGYQLEIRNTGNRKGGYTHIYRLANTG
tara:strand:+ start:71 stop:499 length:429 start_codon:yes stop_codon:yes gene_type:complete